MSHNEKEDAIKRGLNENKKFHIETVTSTVVFFLVIGITIRM